MSKSRRSGTEALTMTTMLARVTMAVRDWLGSWSSGDKALAALFGRGPTLSGVNMTEDTALTVAAVWACVQLIAGNLASLPLIHFRRTGTNSRERATDTKLYRLLHDEPNEEMSAPQFLETLQAHLLLWGNAFAEIRRDGAGRVSSLYPIEPWRVSGVRQQGIAGALFYRIAQTDGTDAILPPEDILHVPGLSPNGVWGYSVIRKARESFGLALAEENFSASFFGKGSTFGGVISAPGVLSPPNEERLRTSLEARHQGVERAHQFIILQNGMTYTSVGIPARDAQFLQQRQFQTAEIARWFGVPPHLIGDVERSTSWGAGIQEQTIGFLQFTLRRWLIKWEKELNRKLISPLERNLQFIEFLVDALERADQESRYRAYEIGARTGFLSINEIRAFENLPALKNGDEHLVPLNMTTLDAMAKQAALPPEAPAPAPPPAEEDEDEAEAMRRLTDLQAGLIQVRDGVARVEARPEPALDLGPVLERLERLAAKPEPPAVDLTPVLERINAASADVIAATPAPASLEPVLDALAAVAGQMQEIRETPPPPAPPPPDLAPVLERLESLEQDRQAAEGERRARLAEVLPGVEEMLLKAATRYIKREADRARRAAISVEKLAGWAATFYPRQVDYAVKELRAPVEVCLALAGRPGHAEAEIRERILADIAGAQGAIAGLLQAPPEDLRAAVEQLATQWEAERPATLIRGWRREVIHGA